MLPVFTSPRARRRGSVAFSVDRKGVVLSGRERDSALNKDGARDGGGGAGMERSTTDRAESEGSEAEAEPAS
jgi:hypothetical protein